MTVAVTNKLSYELAKTVHRLWLDHAVWMRQYLIAAIDQRADAPEAAARLLRSADEFGDLLEIYYSRRSARRVAKLLRQHAMVAIDLVEAARAADRTKFKDIDDVWTSTGEQFVDELCAVNLSWSKPELLVVWDLLRALTKAQIAARLELNFDHDVENFDQILTTAGAFADHMADGILRQFADEFAA